MCPFFDHKIICDHTRFFVVRDSMARAMTREVIKYPGYRLSRDGQVFFGTSQSPLPLEVRDGRYQKLLTVQIGQLWERVDLLLSETFYDGAIVVPRDGNMLDLRSGNVIAVKNVPTFKGDLKRLDGDRMQWIWNVYEYQKTRVLYLAEKTGLVHFQDEDFVRILTAIMREGIRLWNFSLCVLVSKRPVVRGNHWDSHRSRSPRSSRFPARCWPTDFHPSRIWAT